MKRLGLMLLLVLAVWLLAGCNDGFQPNNCILWGEEIIHTVDSHGVPIDLHIKIYLNNDRPCDNT